MSPPSAPKPYGFQFKKLAASVAMALLFSHAHAAGWGELTVQSALGQPLRAEIEIVSTSPQDDATLSVRVASFDAYRQANIEFHPVLMSLRFAVEQRGARQVVRVTSTQPVNEPFVDMLLELSSGSGRIVREFVFLLDPVSNDNVQAAAAVPAREAAVPPVRAQTPRPARARPPAQPVPAGKPAAAAAAASKPRLTLSGVTATSATDPKAGIIALEDYATMEKQMAEANARVKALEQKVTDLQKLLEVTNTLLAELQKQNDMAKPAAAPAPVTQAPAPAPVAATPAAPAPAPATARPAPPAPVAPPEEETDYLLPGAGLLATLLGAAGIYISRRRKARQTDTAGEHDNTRFDMMSTSTSNADTATTALGTGMLLPTGLGHTTHEVDPLAEADVYIAYGRDVQAEDILKEALHKEPDRHAVCVKLLSIYAGRKDLHSFEALARELHGMTRGEGKDWSRAAELGREIDPGNALYAVKTKPLPEPEPELVLERVTEEEPAPSHLNPQTVEEIMPAAVVYDAFDSPEVRDEALPAVPLLIEETPGSGPGPIDFDFTTAAAESLPDIPELPVTALDDPKTDTNLLDFDFLKPDAKAESVPELPLAVLGKTAPEEEAMLDFDFLKPETTEGAKAK